MTNILWVVNRNTANNPYNIRNALERYTDHDVVLIQGDTCYIQYPRDGTLMAQDMTQKEFAGYFEWADIVHLNECDYYGTYPPPRKAHFKDGVKVNMFQYLKAGHHKVLRHANGTYYRDNHQVINSWARQHNILQTCSTPDLVSCGADYWLPQPLPLWRPQYSFRDPPLVEDKIIISHCPTDRDIKSTSSFLKAASYFPQVEVRLIENVEHQTCMKLKQECHIHYDQYKLGAYGVSALEALVLGQVPAVGLHRSLPHIPNHPFVDVGVGWIKSALAQAIHIVEDRQRQMSYLERGREWLKRVHSDDVVIHLLMDIYGEALVYV